MQSLFLIKYKQYYALSSTHLLLYFPQEPTARSCLVEPIDLLLQAKGTLARFDPLGNLVVATTLSVQIKDNSIKNKVLVNIRFEFRIVHLNGNSYV